MVPVFETGTPELAELQDKTYVGSGRFILEPGKPVTVESVLLSNPPSHNQPVADTWRRYKISEVAA